MALAYLAWQTSDASTHTYMPDCPTRVQYALKPPRGKNMYHLYCSEHLAGGRQLAEELQEAMNSPTFQLKITSKTEHLPLSEVCSTRSA